MSAKACTVGIAVHIHDISMFRHLLKRCKRHKLHRLAQIAAELFRTLRRSARRSNVGVSRVELQKRSRAINLSLASLLVFRREPDVARLRVFRVGEREKAEAVTLAPSVWKTVNTSALHQTGTRNRSLLVWSHGNTVRRPAPHDLVDRLLCERLLMLRIEVVLNSRRPEHVSIGCRPTECERRKQVSELDVGACSAVQVDIRRLTAVVHGKGVIANESWSFVLDCGRETLDCAPEDRVWSASALSVRPAGAEPVSSRSIRA